MIVIIIQNPCVLLTVVRNYAANGNHRLVIHVVLDFIITNQVAKLIIIILTIIIAIIHPIRIIIIIISGFHLTLIILVIIAIIIARLII